MISRLRLAARRVWTRVLLSFIICLFPLLGLQIVIQQRGARLIREQVYGSAFANVDYLSAHFDAGVKTLHNTAEYLLNVDVVREFFVYQAAYSTAEYYAKVDGVIDFLYRMSQSNPLIAEIHLYFPRSSLMLCARRAGRSYLQTIDDGEALEGRILSSSAAQSLLIEQDGEFRVASLVGTLSAGQPPALYLEIILNQQEMAQCLSSYTASGEKLSFLYHHAGSAMLFSDGVRRSDDARFQNVLRQEASNASPYLSRITLDGARYLLVAAYVPSIRCSFGQLILASDLEFIPRSLQLGMYVFVGVFFLALVALFLTMRFQIDRPTRHLLAAFDATGSGRFDTRVRDNTAQWPLEYQLLSQHFNDMNEHTEQLIHEMYEQQLSLRQAQLKQLQAQINPHFLYNSFFLLRGLISSQEQEQAERFLLCLGRYFQYITHNVSEDASLEEEYQHAQSYLSIQLMRFEDRLQTEIPPLPAPLGRLRVPRLMLQPLYENILVHGEWADGEVRRIRLGISQTQDAVRLTIDDNGRGVTQALIDSVRTALTSRIPAEFTSGLTNIHHRLTLLGRGGGLDVDRSPLGGFRVIISIPKEN